MVDVNKGPLFTMESSNNNHINLIGEAGKQTPAKFKAQSQKRLQFDE